MNKKPITRMWLSFNLNHMHGVKFKTAEQKSVFRPYTTRTYSSGSQIFLYFQSNPPPISREIAVNIVLNIRVIG